MDGTVFSRRGGQVGLEVSGAPKPKLPDGLAQIGANGMENAVSGNLPHMFASSGHVSAILCEIHKTMTS